jgi:hypothetical protein
MYKRAYFRHKAVLVADIQTAGRFVEEEDPGILGQGPGDLYQLKLSPAYFV